MKEWMLSEPCECCPEGDGYSWSDCVDSKYIKDCVHFISYRKAKYAQIKLLKWLIVASEETRQNNQAWVIDFKDMLTELEAQK